MSESDAKVLADVIWSYWKDLGVKKPAMTWIELFQVCQFFFNECKKRDIDPATVDIRSEVDSRISFYENKDHINEILSLIAPPIRDEKELLQEELDRLVGDTEFRVLSEKELDKLEGYERKAEKLAKRVDELQAERERERREAAEKIASLERELVAAPTIRLRIMSDFKEGIVEFRAGQVLETKNRGWALSKIRERLAEEVPPEEVVPAPPPVVPPPIRPPERGIIDSTVAQLQDIAYRRIGEAGLRWIEHRGSVERDIEISKALYADLSVEEAKKKAVERLERLLETIAPKKAPPPKRPPRAPEVEYVPILEFPRRVKVMTRECWVCGVSFSSDIDLEDRLRRNEILRFPAEFYELCSEHKNEKYGYNSVEEAVAYQLVEGRDTAWKKTGLRGMRVLTKTRLRDIGLTDADIAKIQAIETERWRP